MAQIAQQDHLYIEVANLTAPTDAEKAQIRKAYLRGTALDIILKGDVQGMETQTKVVQTKVITGAPVGNGLTAFVTIGSQITGVACGEFQPSDYTDDTPSPDVQ